MAVKDRFRGAIRRVASRNVFQEHLSNALLYIR